jgi:hypothetical protein
MSEDEEKRRQMKKNVVGRGAITGRRDGLETD